MKIRYYLFMLIFSNTLLYRSFAKIIFFKVFPVFGSYSMPKLKFYKQERLTHFCKIVIWKHPLTFFICSWTSYITSHKNSWKLLRTNIPQHYTKVVAPSFCALLYYNEIVYDFFFQLVIFSCNLQPIQISFPNYGVRNNSNLMIDC